VLAFDLVGVTHVGESVPSSTLDPFTLSDVRRRFGGEDGTSTRSLDDVDTVVVDAALVKLVKLDTVDEEEDTLGTSIRAETTGMDFVSAGFFPSFFLVDRGGGWLLFGTAFNDVLAIVPWVVRDRVATGMINLDDDDSNGIRYDSRWDRVTNAKVGLQLVEATTPNANASTMDPRRQRCFRISVWLARIAAESI